MRISKEVLDTMMKQVTLDCNVDESSEIAKGVFLAPSKILPGSRIINKTDPFFRVVVLMGKAYIMADESILGGCEELFKDSKPEWFFSFSNLRQIDYILHEFGKEIVDTHIYFLPAEGANVEKPYGNEIWLREKEIALLKDKNTFHRALCYSPTQPDVIAVALKENDEMIAMAGASDDGKYTYQIGIDVNEKYSGRGLGVHLVSLLKQKIIEEGKLPFYGTSESHAISRTIAINSGFMPAFSEFTVKETKDILK